MKTTPGIILAGGGTGGHVFPALAIADELRARYPDARFLFLGTSDKIEARVVPASGYPFRTIWISGFHRSFRPANLLFPAKVAVAMMQSLAIVRGFRPSVVIGTGGYVCGPVLKAARMLGIPTAIHESNSYPGATTRMLASGMDRVFTAFETTQQWLKRSDNVELVGTPVRQKMLQVDRDSAVRAFGLDPARRTVLIFGGSLGAASINEAVAAALGQFVRHDIQVIWQTGTPDAGRYRSAVAPGSPVWVGPFIDAMEEAYAAADIVVCRAGATTIAELTVLGKPAILVPYPHAAADHQTVNAQTLKSAGAAEMIRDAEVRDHLGESVELLIRDEERRGRMRSALLRLGRPDAARRIADALSPWIA